LGTIVGCLVASRRRDEVLDTVGGGAVGDAYELGEPSDELTSRVTVEAKAGRWKASKARTLLSAERKATMGEDTKKRQRCLAKQTLAFSRF
ncbi:hypothetical protein C2E31_18920, partial [Rhodopirellula baltica]